MNAEAFVILVRLMRAAQKAYYKQQNQSNLRMSIDLERQVDWALEEGIKISERIKQLDMFTAVNPKENNDERTK